MHVALKKHITAIQKRKRNIYTSKYGKKEEVIKVQRKNLMKTIKVLNVRLKSKVLPLTRIKTLNVRMIKQQLLQKVIRQTNMDNSKYRSFMN